MKKSDKKRLGPSALTMRWVAVTDDAGHTRMEMRWSAPKTVRKFAL